MLEKLLIPNVAFRSYLDDESDGVGSMSPTSFQALYTPRTAVQREVVEQFMENIGVGLNGIRALKKQQRKEAVKKIKERQSPRYTPPTGSASSLRPTPPTVPRYNTGGARASIGRIRTPTPPVRDEASVMYQAQMTAERNAQRNRINENRAGLKDVKSTYIKSFATLSRMTTTDIKNKLINEKNIQSYQLAGLDKQQLIERYLTLSGIFKSRERQDYPA